MPRYKVGDKLKCIQPLTGSVGSGHKLNKSFIVDHIDDYGEDGTVYWPVNDPINGFQKGLYIYERSCILDNALVEIY